MILLAKAKLIVYIHEYQRRPLWRVKDARSFIQKKAHNWLLEKKFFIVIQVCDLFQMQLLWKQQAILIPDCAEELIVNRVISSIQ